MRGVYLRMSKASSWPLQDIHSVRGLCTRSNTIIRNRPLCLGTALPPLYRLHDCARHCCPPIILSSNTCHTILAMAISCKGQGKEAAAVRVAGARIEILRVKGARPAATNEPLWVNSLCSCASASFDCEFRRFDYRKLEVESHRRTGHL